MDKDEIRNEIEKRIQTFLEKPDITAIELKYLSEAYAELNKNDWMKAIVNQPTYFNSGIGGLENQNTINSSTKE